MGSDARKVKMLLILQSFLPLFVLLGLKHCDCGDCTLFKKFFVGLFSKDWWAVIVKALNYNEVYRILILFLCLVWGIVSLLYMFVFKDIQTAGFDSSGKKIKNVSYTTDVGLNFFVSFLLPLLVDIKEVQDVLVFIGMLVLMILLMWKSKLFYANPVLTIWGYKTFKFSFTDSEEACIGITHKKDIDSTKKVKSKRIADRVFFIYNE